MLKEMIEKIVSLAPVSTHKVGPVEFSAQKLHEVLPPMKHSQRLQSLTSLVAKAVEDFENEVATEIVLSSPTQASIVDSKRDDYGRIQELAYVDLSHLNPSLVDGNRYSVEDFILNLQRSFKRDANMESLLELVSNIKLREESDLVDDGITQTVSAKSGTTLTEKVTIKNPMKLKPFVAFPEIDVPSKEFIFRIHRNGVSSVSVSLSTSDSVQWELQVLELVKKWILAKNDKLIVR